MAVASEDPALLFTPVRGVSESGRAADAEETLSPLSLDAQSLTRHDAMPDAPQTQFYVDVPRLSEAESSKYQPLEDLNYVNDSDSEGASSKIEEIEGEHRLGDRLYLYARYGDGILRRKEDWEFRTGYPEVYEDYMRRKKDRKVPTFDPSSLRIHPKHRVQLVINLQRRKPRRSVDRDYVSDSEPSEEDTDDVDSDEYEGTYVRRSTRASKRQSSKQVRALPYSPKTRRTRKGVHAGSPTTDSDESGSEQSIIARRSSRRTKKISYAMHDDSDYRSETDESTDYEETRSLGRKKQIRRKGPKPAYGRIRQVDDLYDSDQETAALRTHRGECEKCHRPPAHILLKRLGKRTKKKRKNEDDLSENEEDYIKRLGGWVRCLKCCVAAHWNCLARTQRMEIIKAARAKATADSTDGNSKKMSELEVTETTEFVCGSCSKGGTCMICQEVVIEPERKPSEPVTTGASEAGKDIEDASTNDQKAEIRSLFIREESARELLFRCSTCKRLAHYAHLPIEDEDLSLVEVAEFYQRQNDWQCGDCASYIFRLDKIIAWRPSSPNAVDPYMTTPENANYKENLPREYLVKWVGRSFRRLEWVPHMWLVAKHWTKLKYFYELGPRLDILSSPADEVSAPATHIVPILAIANTEDERSRSASVEHEHVVAEATTGPPPPTMDAELRIPPLWKTTERVLDVLLWSPRKWNGHVQKKRATKQVMDIETDSKIEASSEAQAEYDRALDLGEEPSTDVTETVDEFEERTGRELTERHIGRVIWAFIKWSDLPYDESTWDSPPRPGSFGYADFERAFRYFLLSRKVVVKKKNKDEASKFDDRKEMNVEELEIPEHGEYDIGQERYLKLMPFQVNGVNWLCRNWFQHQQCILADEMGLGKTVQIITFLGLLHARMGAFPCLVVVPNSTITNWVREFARWAPGLRVVPFYGEQKSREIIKDYELQHDVITPGTTGAKYHVLVTTYEAVINPKDFNVVFKKNPRWEVLVVDEGQRLKSDSSLLFRRLNELNSCHRIIMTGTPLNNNVRELFNLMNFLDPNEWRDLEALTRQYEELDEDRVKDLHERLRPYFLRRIKAEVLDLPAKNEVIVPVSMAPLQKEVYKSILSKNLAILRSLTSISSAKLNKSAVKSSNLKNMLMQLRKCLQHPYLVADDIEPKGLSPLDAHLKLIDASGKLRLLKVLLPKLRARGNRVLLFSQFVIGLNIIEDFLQGEGYKFLRLDGNTKQADRQKDMDEFNKEISDVFIYILSTRAGGVGINLWSADTVIIFDPDFNPHQDLQAIARAHRYGQKKTVLVFKFMTKDSAEEKIIQTGKKKLVLDHLIVQKMDDQEDSGEVQSILMFGAKALFEEGSAVSRDIAYSENDIEALIEKTEAEAVKQTPETSNNAFSFAKVWSANKDNLDELPDEAAEYAQGDSWAQTLQKIAEEQGRVQVQEKVGRGARRKAAMTKKYFEDVSPDRLLPMGKKRQKSAISGSSDDEFKLPQSRQASEAASTGTSITEGESEQKRHRLDDDINTLDLSKPQQKARAVPVQSLSPIMNQGKIEYCGLCLTRHAPGSCYMTENSLNLVEYRKLLIDSEEESYDDRIKAIEAIDETLLQRGGLHLIAGQRMLPLKKRDLDWRSNLTSGAIREGNNSSHQHALPAVHREANLRQGESQEIRWRTVQTASDMPRASDDTRNPISLLKRGPMLTPEAPVAKKQKVQKCDICMGTPYHLPVHCPVVAGGPKSVLKAITRLTNERGNPATLTALRGILRKQRKAQETGNATGSTEQVATSSKQL